MLRAGCRGRAEVQDKPDEVLLVDLLPFLDKAVTVLTHPGQFLHHWAEPTNKTFNEFGSSLQTDGEIPQFTDIGTYCSHVLPRSPSVSD